MRPSTRSSSGKARAAPLLAALLLACAPGLLLLLVVQLAHRQLRHVRLRQVVRVVAAATAATAAATPASPAAATACKQRDNVETSAQLAREKESTQELGSEYN